MLEVVLIDDDQLIHELWKMAAKESACKISCFFDADEFLKNAAAFSKDTPVYVDSNLANAKGEVEAYRLKEAGFTQLYITTGYNKQDIDAPDFIVDVVGKRPDHLKS